MRIEELSFVKAFIRLATDGDRRGWHERNGGNLSYRMTGADINACSAQFDTAAPWIPVKTAVPLLAGDCILLTGSGKCMRNIAAAPTDTVGIIELNGHGDAYRIVWGLIKSRPTSELPTHLAVAALKKTEDAEKNRVIYHAHPAHLIALTFILPIDDARFTRELWEMDIENPLVFPEGIGIVPWVIPGSEAAAAATLEKMKRYRAVVWAHHGTFVCGDDFDDTFGLMDVLEKSAQICGEIIAMGGKRQSVTAADLNALADMYNLHLNEAALVIEEQRDCPGEI